MEETAQEIVPEIAVEVIQVVVPSEVPAGEPSEVVVPAEVPAEEVVEVPVEGAA